MRATTFLGGQKLAAALLRTLIAISSREIVTERIDSMVALLDHGDDGQEGVAAVLAECAT